MRIADTLESLEIIDSDSSSKPFGIINFAPLTRLKTFIFLCDLTQKYVQSLLTLPDCIETLIFGEIVEDLLWQDIDN